MTCNHNCNQGRTCQCRVDTQPPADLDKDDKADVYTAIAIVLVFVGLIIWSLV